MTKKTRALGLALHMGLAVIGPGMLTLPYALQHSGVVLGFGILFTSYLVSILSCLVIFDAAAFVARRDQAGPCPSYGYLIKELLSSRWAVLLDIALVVSGFGGAVSFLIFLGDFVPLAVRTDLWIGNRQGVITVASIICTALSTADNGVSHPIISAIPMIGFTVTIGLMVYRLHSVRKGVRRVGVSELWDINPTWAALPDTNLYLFVFLMQANLLPTCAALSPVANASDNPSTRLLTDQGEADSPGAPGCVDGRLCVECVDNQKCVENRGCVDSRGCVEKQEYLGLRASASFPWLGVLSRGSLARALLMSHTCAFVYYAVVACLGVLLVRAHTPTQPASGTHTTVWPMNQNFTQTLPGDDPVFFVMRGVLIICLVALSPYLLSAVANGLMNLKAIACGEPLVPEGFGSFRKRLAYGGGLVFASALVASHTDRVATVLTVCGGWGATVLMASCPAVLLADLRRQQRRKLSTIDYAQIVLFTIVTALGFLASLAPALIKSA